MYIFLCVSIYKKPLYLLKATQCDSRQNFPTLIQEKKNLTHHTDSISANNLAHSIHTLHQASHSPCLEFYFLRLHLLTVLSMGVGSQLGKSH